jgi:hypothetical protein
MRPLAGVVVRHNRKFMKIELESGNVLTAKPVDGIDRGDKVDVSYDFTHNRINSVKLRGEGDHQPEEPIDMEEHTEDIPTTMYHSNGAFSNPDFDEVEGTGEEVDLEEEAFSDPSSEDWEGEE